MVLLTELLQAVHIDPNVAQVIDCDPSPQYQANSPGQNVPLNLITSAATNIILSTAIFH